MNGIPNRYRDRDWFGGFGIYVRQLFEVRIPDFVEPGMYDDNSQAAYRAGFVHGATAIVSMLDEDDFEQLMERFEDEFADEIAILAEHHT